MSTLWSFLTLPTTFSADSTQTQLIPLVSLATLSLTGSESAKFLQGQCTTDFREVEKGRVLPGAICSLKGRVLYSFIAVPQGENISLILPGDQINDALTHLKKFAIFSKTKLDNAGEQQALVGLTGDNAQALVKQLLGEAPQIGEVRHGGNGRWVTALSDKRFLLSIPAELLQNDWKTLSANTTPAAETAWQLADIAAGYATITSSTRDLFQPQELNYPALEAVSYTKGCYTGQEIVARLYFRGKLKQRLYRFSVAKDVSSITERGIFSGETHVGDVVTLAGNNHHGELLAIVKNKAINDSLTLGKEGAALQLLTLPYVLDADKEE